MFKSLAVAVLAVAALSAAPPAGAQTRTTPLASDQSLSTSRTGIPAFNPAQGVGQVPNGPSFRVLGVPVQVNAPVNAPYVQSSLQTFAGQPMLSSDAVIAHGFGTVGGTR